MKKIMGDRRRYIKVRNERRTLTSFDHAVIKPGR